MGMFDYVRCEPSLPDGWDYSGDHVGLQTKDFDCEMTTLLIRADGRLLVERFEYEEVPKAERPYPDDDGLLGMCGMLRRINCRWDDLNFHGLFHFGALEVIGRHPPDDRGWAAPIFRDHDYVAKFTDGQLISLTVSSDVSDIAEAAQADGGSAEARAAIAKATGDAS